MTHAPDDHASNTWTDDLGNPSAVPFIGFAQPAGDLAYSVWIGANGPSQPEGFPIEGIILDAPSADQAVLIFQGLLQATSDEILRELVGRPDLVDALTRIPELQYSLPECTSHERLARQGTLRRILSCASPTQTPSATQRLSALFYPTPPCHRDDGSYDCLVEGPQGTGSVRRCINVSAPDPETACDISQGLATAASVDLLGFLVYRRGKALTLIPHVAGLENEAKEIAARYLAMLHLSPADLHGDC